MYDVLIADDEEHVRLEIEHLIKDIPWIKKIYFADNGIEALSIIADKKPKVVFLDIDMPGIDGIKLGQVTLQMNTPPYIIYITAYDQYAIEAFKVNAVAYLLKPIDSIEMKAKLKHLEKIFFEEKRDNLDVRNSSHCRKITCKIDEKYVFFDQNDILLAYAKDRKVYLRLINGTEVYGSTLSSLEEKLDKNQFIRCHRNFIVNIFVIEEVSPWFNGTYILKIKEVDDINVIVSRHYIKDFKKKMSLD